MNKGINFDSMLSTDVVDMVIKENKTASLFFLISNARGQVLDAVRRQNPLFYNVNEKRMEDMNNSSLANFLAIQYFGGFISLRNLKASNIMPDSDQTPKGKEMSDIFLKNAEIYDFKNSI